MRSAMTYRRRSAPQSWPFAALVGPSGEVVEAAQLDAEGRRMLATLQGFGSWLGGQRWYVDELLAPATETEVIGMRALPFSLRQLPATVPCRYLSRTLNTILGPSPRSYGVLMRDLLSATQCVVELRVDIDAGRPVCREVRILPADIDGAITRIPRVPLDDFVGHYIRTWYAVSGTPRPKHRRALTPAVLQAVALAYRANPNRPTQAVAERFGWRSPNLSWALDASGRARASRAISAARDEGYLRKAPGARRKGEKPADSG